MRKFAGVRAFVVMAVVGAGLTALVAGRALGHCDSTKGPLIPEAVAALESGEITPVLKWVRAGDEAEIRDAFEKAVKVRAMGGEAAEVADRFFLETLVRVHRAGEGAPFTGIKDEPVEPVIRMADEALASGSADAMLAAISAHMEQAIRDRLARVTEARAHRDESVEAGREYVEAYVEYVHFIEGIHAAMERGDTHAEAHGH